MDKFMRTIISILAITLPAIKALIQSKVVPVLKRKAYETLDKKADKLIKDLAQNAAKIKNETDINKKAAYIEGTQLGIDTLYLLSDKFKKAADEIKKVIQ